MSFRRLCQILEDVEMDIAITEPVEKRVLKAYTMGPDDVTPLSEFPVVQNWPEGFSDGRDSSLLNSKTYVVRVQIYYGIAGQAENREVAIALFDAAYRLFDRERQADWRLGTDEGHLLDISVDGPPIGTLRQQEPQESVNAKGYTGSQLLLTFQVFDRDPLP